MVKLRLFTCHLDCVLYYFMTPYEERTGRTAVLQASVDMRYADVYLGGQQDLELIFLSKNFLRDRNFIARKLLFFQYYV